MDSGIESISTNFFLFQRVHAQSLNLSFLCLLCFFFVVVVILLAFWYMPSCIVSMTVLLRPIIDINAGSFSNYKLYSCDKQYEKKGLSCSQCSSNMGKFCSVGAVS